LIAKGTRPLVLAQAVQVPANVVVLSAASGTQISGLYDEKQHGLLTYHLLRGLQGEAAGKGKAIKLDALYGYLKPRVIRQARIDNREQEPQLTPAKLSGAWADEDLAVLR
jgi:uncharacterized caspase-like protein